MKFFHVLRSIQIIKLEEDELNLEEDMVEDDTIDLSI
jgi:hypothetical protein